MRLFMLELKRLLKNRRTLLIVGVLLAFTVFMAVMPTTYLMSHTADGDTLTGLDALAYDKELQSGIAGTVTPEKVRDSLETYQSVFARYGADSTFDLPDAAYAEINAVQSLLNGVGDLYPAENGQPTPWLVLDAEAVASYYEAAPARIAGLMAMEYPNDPAPAAYFLDLYSAVETPFTYVPGADATALEYMMLLALVLLLCCAVIAAPVFTSDLQSGADDIQRCTKHGRTPLALVRVLAVFLICGVLSAVCLSLYWLISDSLYGWEILDTSAQMLSLFSPTTPLPFSYGELQVVLALLALVTILASVSAILLISARMKNLVAATCCALLLCVLPVLTYVILPTSVVDWVNTFLPSSGVGLQACTLYALRDFHLLRLGDFLCWTPIAMTVVSAAELVLFALLAIVSHVRRRA